MLFKKNFSNKREKMGLRKVLCAHAVLEVVVFLISASTGQAGRQAGGRITGRQTGRR
jgi:hypothetical protein